MKQVMMQPLRGLSFQTAILVLVICLMPSIKLAGSMQCSGIPENDRFDCHPGEGASQQTCQERGCCWVPAKDLDEGVPHCYYPRDFPTYQMGSLNQTKFGYSVMLTRTTKSYFPGDIMQLQMDVYFETSYRLHFKVRKNM